MRVSWNWLSELVDLDELEGPKALADLLTSRGLEVESIERQDHGFEKVVTAQVLDRKPHPQAERLSLCEVTLGTGPTLQIVCGAPNVNAGQIVALAQVGAHLPNGIKISASSIRGIVSNGMICSEEELKLTEKESDGIMVLPSSTPLGQPLAKILGRDDTILTLKLTANRSDCLSHFGIAREVGAALGKKPKRPKSIELEFKNSPISVQLELGELVPQYFGCSIRGVKVGPSPKWLSQRLEALGHRSINNVVDATNWVMFELGYPVHAFDATSIHGNKIRVRMASQGEKIPLLDGSTLTLTGAEMVIADEDRPIALAGIMGGGNSEVRDDTQDIFLEISEFNASTIRRTAILHQKRTEGSHRWERGVDPTAANFVTGRLASLITELAGGQIVGSICVQLPSRTFSLDSGYRRKLIRFESHYINDFLGLERDCEPLTLKKTEEILRSLDCEVVREAQGWRVSPPPYRLDLEIKEDLAEEIARSLGYDAIPATIPPLSGTPVFADSALSKLAILDRAKESLVQCGLQEVVNFAFTSKSWLSKFELTSSAKIANPLSEEHEVLVPSLLPGLVRNALNNWHHHFGSEPLAIRLFEIRPVFSSPSADIRAKDQLTTGIQENWKLAFVLSGPRYAESLRSERGEIDFYDVKGIIDQFIGQMGGRGIRYQPLHSSRGGPHPLYHPGQSVEILAGNSVLGHFGLFHPEKARDLKVRAPLWLGEMDFEILTKFSRQAYAVPSFKVWPEFPQMERDFALVVKNDITADKICQVAMKSGKPLVKGAKVFDIYRGSQVAEGMTSIAVRVIFYDEGRSLQESETDAASAQILERWKKELGAELRG